MSSLDLAVLMENLRREADVLLHEKQPFIITVSYDGIHLISSLKNDSASPTAGQSWGVKNKKEKSV